MIVFEKAIQFLLCIIEVFIVLDFAGYVNEYRKGSEKSARKLIVLPFVLALFLINQFEIPLLNLTGGFFCCFLCTLCLFEEKWKRLVASTALAYLVLVCGEIIGECIMSVLVGVDSLLSLDHYITLAFLLLFEKMIALFLVKALQGFFMRKGNRAGNLLFKECLVLPVATCVLFGLLFTFQLNEAMKDSEKMALCLSCFGILFANIFVFSKMEQMSEFMENSKKMELLSLKYEMQKENYENLDAINEEHRRFMHDIRKYLQTIGGLAVQNNNRDIIGFLEELDIKIGELENMQYSSNRILNALLLERREIAGKKEIHFEAKVEPGLEIIQVGDVDLITMLGNLLDNAIEAAEKCPPGAREICVHIFQGNKHFLMIQIENSICREPVRENNLFVSTKKNPEKHGIGLKNVRKVVSRYGGVLEYEIGNQICKAGLVIPNDIKNM